MTFAVAAKEARLEHIVGLTQWLASPSRGHGPIKVVYSAGHISLTTTCPPPFVAPQHQGCSGGFRYRPTMSSSFSAKSGL